MGKIRLDLDEDALYFDPKEWKIYDGNIAFHSPTFTLFKVECDLKEGRVGLEDFTATLDHVYDGHPAPQGEELTTIGRAAIAMVLIEQGFWKPVITDVPKPRGRKPSGPTIQ